MKEESADRKERKWMRFLLITGIVILIAGVWASWEIGAFEPEEFLQRPTVIGNQTSRNKLFTLIMYNSPWLVGIAMIIAALQYFHRNRK